MSVAIPIQELTLDAIRNAKLRTRRRLTELMIVSGKAQNADQVTVREVRANSDLGIANGTDTEEYTLPATVANTDTVYVNAALGNNKYLGIYGIVVVTANVRSPIIGVQFKIGTGGANVLSDVDIQQGFPFQIPAWYLDDPVIYQPTDTVYIVVQNAVTMGANGVQLVIRGFLAEPAGQTTM